jgi:hypothetical protein
MRIPKRTGAGARPLHQFCLHVVPAAQRGRDDVQIVRPARGCRVDLRKRVDSSLGQVWKVSCGRHVIVVVVQDHESADSGASADQQVYT